jgi:hypothetical protein
VVLRVEVDVEVAGALYAFLERHGGDMQSYLSATVKRVVEEIERVEGSRPNYGDPAPQPKQTRRANFAPHVI